ncbi:MAG TPA: hypothetical protein VGO06_12205 [Bosea sp. (in: a-proteobacteria)]|nr:hypothetical protein [Bosea sp. (in: a-proteobacteria)]
MLSEPAMAGLKRNGFREAGDVQFDRRGAATQINGRLMTSRPIEGILRQAQNWRPAMRAGPIKAAPSPLDIRTMTRIQERGRARLKLRLPSWRDRFDLASGQAFLDVCEAYDLTCAVLEYWAKSEAPTRSSIIAEYEELMAALELEAQLFATREAVEGPKPRRS